jgi:hypothetical protein
VTSALGWATKPGRIVVEAPPTSRCAARLDAPERGCAHLHLRGLAISRVVM